MLNELSETTRASHQPKSPFPTAVRLRGKILLAEDGPDNQAFISMIVRQAGAEVELAANGRLAVEKALGAMSAGAPYDVILIDMQMPELDGYDATRQLRRSGYKGPIVALTAHVMAEDRQKCLAAGCDDYASKPVDRLGLLRILGRLMGCPADLPANHPDQLMAGASEDAAAAAPAPASPETALRSQFADDPDMTAAIAAFVARLPGILTTMSEALANNGHEELRRLAHQLKGAGSGYGYPMLTEQARKLEDAAKAADVEAARLALNDLRASARVIIAGRAASPALEGSER